MAVIAKNWQELKKPNRLESRPTGGDPRRRGVFVAEPLERGFGLTLGNALRRVLLSSLQGAAVTAIKLDGALHEFSSLPGVREDVTDIVLNIKQVAIRMTGEGPKRLQLNATGPGPVKAGQIVTTGDIDVMNPELVICTLDQGAKLNMELTVETGKGYVPASGNRPVDAPIGLIPVDALYSPVRQVAYKIDKTRVGQELDYDKLTVDGGDGRDAHTRRRARLCCAHLAGSVAVVHQLQRARPVCGASRAGVHQHHRGVRARADDAAAQPLPVEEGGRARIERAFGELPQER